MRSRWGMAVLVAAILLFVGGMALLVDRAQDRNRDHFRADCTDAGFRVVQVGHSLLCLNQRGDVITSRSA